MVDQTQDRITHTALVAQVRRLTANGSAKRLRERARLSLQDVGDAVGVSAVTIWRWELDKASPRPALAARYGALLAELMELDSPEGAE